MIVPVYIAELLITTPEVRAGIHQESRTAFYSFEPIPDMDRWIDGKIHHRRLGGEEPTYFLDALGGELIRHGEKLFLKTVRRHVVDVRDALCLAKVKSPDICFRRPSLAAKAEPVPTPAPPEARPGGPVMQLSLFGEGGAL